MGSFLKLLWRHEITEVFFLRRRSLQILHVIVLPSRRNFLENKVVYDLSSLCDY